MGKTPHGSGHYCRGKAVTFTAGPQEVAGSSPVAPVIFQIHSGPHGLPQQHMASVTDRKAQLFKIGWEKSQDRQAAESPFGQAFRPILTDDLGTARRKSV